MWLKGVKTLWFCLEIAMNALSAPAAFSMFITTVKILDFQMNALSGPCRAKRVHPY